MAGKPIATVGSMHVCPLVNGTVPHVGGPIVGPGAPNVLINGKPVAVMGDTATCAGPPDTIVQGNPSVLINGVPVACQGDMTAHGGTITAGDPTVLISTATPKPSVTMPLKKIPFPKINILDDIGSALVGKAKSHKQGKENIEELKKDDEDNPMIYNLQWVKEDICIRDSKVLKEVTLRASVYNIPDGQSVTFKVSRMANDTGNEGLSDKEMVELTGTVKNKMVEVIWKIEEEEES